LEGIHPICNHTIFSSCFIYHVATKQFLPKVYL
jgi:hypothetical protein